MKHTGVVLVSTERFLSSRMLEPDLVFKALLTLMDDVSCSLMDFRAFNLGIQNKLTEGALPR
jgi:hypothetical protein